MVPSEPHPIVMVLNFLFLKLPDVSSIQSSPIMVKGDTRRSAISTFVLFIVFLLLSYILALIHSSVKNYRVARERNAVSELMRSIGLKLGLIQRRTCDRFQKMKFKIPTSVCICLLLLTMSSGAAIKSIAKDPYVSAIVVDCATGKVIFEDHADTPAYPASILKIMDLLLIVEYVEQGKTTLSERITANAEAANTGGSQVYLKEHEVFILDDMLYAMMIQSANDAAVALAIHYAGSKDAFVGLMNKKAAELGMKNTVFHSVHGLPPSTDQKPDITTARDMARLGMEVVKHPLALKYTSIQEKGFRNDTFQMRTHNNLLGVVEGVDGLKTGYIRAAGFSIVATAERGGRRIVLAILGSASKTVRDKKATELIAHAFLNLPEPEVVVAPPPVQEAEAEAAAPSEKRSGSIVGKGFLAKLALAVSAVLVLLAVSRSAMKKRFRKYEFD